MEWDDRGLASVGLVSFLDHLDDRDAFEGDKAAGGGRLTTRIYSSQTEL
jgi:hypothetical protein